MCVRRRQKVASIQLIYSGAYLQVSGGRAGEQAAHVLTIGAEVAKAAADRWAWSAAAATADQWTALGRPRCPRE